jgi:hypothetical protein
MVGELIKTDKLLNGGWTNITVKLLYVGWTELTFSFYFELWNHGPFYGSAQERSVTFSLINDAGKDIVYHFQAR